MAHPAIRLTEVVSPELALVDPSLRRAALSALPPVETSWFLSLVDDHEDHEHALHVLAATAHVGGKPRRSQRVLILAVGYIALAGLRTLALGAVAFVAVTLLVLTLSLLA